MKVKYADYVGQTVKARYTVEGNVGGADVPLIHEGDISIYINESGSIRLDDDWDEETIPFDETFELL